MFRKVEIGLWLLVLVAHILLPILDSGFDDRPFSIIIFWPIAFGYLIGSTWFFQNKGVPKSLTLPAILAGIGIFLIFFATPVVIYLTPPPTTTRYYASLAGVYGIIALSWLIALFKKKDGSSALPLILKTSFLSIWSLLLLLLPITTSTGLAIQNFYRQDPSFDKMAKMVKAHSESKKLSDMGDTKAAYFKAQVAMEHGYSWIEVDSNRLDLITHGYYRLKENTTREQRQSFFRETFKNTDSNYLQLCRISNVLMNYCEKSNDWGNTLAKTGKNEEAYQTYYRTLVHLEALREDRCMESSVYYIHAFRAASLCAVTIKESRGQHSADSFLMRFENFHIYEKLPGYSPNPMFLYQLGAAYREIGMKEKAIGYFDRVIENSENYTKRLERTAMAVSCYEQAKLLMFDRQYKEAIAFLDLGQPFLMEEHNAYTATILRARIAYRQSDYEKAESLAREGIALAESFEMGSHAASAHKMLADIYLEREAIDLVMEQREQLVFFAKTDPYLETKVVQIDVELLKMKGQLYKAYELMKNKRALLDAYSSYEYDLSDIEYDLMFYDRALSSFKAYMDTDTSYAQLPSVQKKLHAATLLVATKQLYRSKELIQQVEKQLKKWRSPNSFEVSLINVKGIHAMSRTQYAEAEDYFSQSIAYQDSINPEDIKSLIRLKNNLAKSRLKQGKIHLALKNLLECSTHIRQLKVKEVMATAKTYRLTAACYIELNQPKKAQSLQKKASEIYKAILPENHPIFAVLREE